MKVIVDAYNIALDRGTGVATYGRNFISSIQRIGLTSGLLYGRDFIPQDRVRDLAILRSKIDSPGRLAGRIEAPLGPLRSVRPHRAYPVEWDPIRDANPTTPDAVDELWNARWLYKRAIGAFNKLNIWSSVSGPVADIMHWTYPLPIRLKGARNIYTMHDLVPLLHPELSAENRSTYYELCKKCIITGDLILTVSESSKNDIVKAFPEGETKIVNTYQSHGIDSATARAAETDFESLIRPAFGMEAESYFLFFGAIEPKKNIARLVEGYISSNVQSPLVVVGAPGWNSADSLALLDPYRQLSHAQKIRYVEYLPRHLLLGLISGARAVVFPSLCEGFGLPVLEAMALGTPVITSARGATAEVAGDAALLVDPYDVRDIRQSIVAIDADGQLRERCRQRGLARSSLFGESAYDARLRGALEKAVQVTEKRL